MKNICLHPDGYLVRVIRAGVLYQAFIAYGADRAAARLKAIAMRDEFYAAHGKFARRPARSNTGISGVCEQIKWFRGRPVNCFEVTFGAPGRNNRRFSYRSFGDRERALARAVNYRRRLENRLQPKAAYV